MVVEEKWGTFNLFHFNFKICTEINTTFDSFLDFFC